MEDFFSFMECYGCGNYKQGKLTYYCLMKDEFVVSDESKNLVVEKEQVRKVEKKVLQNIRVTAENQENTM